MPSLSELFRADTCRGGSRLWYRRTDGLVYLALASALAAFVSPGYAAVGRPALDIDLELPAGFHKLPELADSVRAAAAAVAGEKIEVFARAWGDPALGCFVLDMKLRARTGDKSVDNAHQTMADAASASGMRVTSFDREGEVSSFEFTRGDFRGVARTRSSSEDRSSEDGFVTVESATCFYNQRYQKRSEKLCEQILHRIETAQ